MQRLRRKDGGPSRVTTRMTASAEGTLINVPRPTIAVMLALIFHIGTARLALDVRRVKEVVPRVQLQVLAGSPPWLAGAFVYRGQVVPVLDLHQLVGAGDCPPHLSSRIILVPQPGGDEGR